ncbi:MAG: SEC-C domain-containing protein [Nanoarchaeota archaeon]
MKIGRNDPCPCGSGIKYKKCCMTKLNDKLTEYQILLGTEENIKNKLVKWAAQNLELDKYTQYFNGENFQEIVEEKEEGDGSAELESFFDWLFLEAIHQRENKRVIEVIRDDFSEGFSLRELEIIDEWINHTQAGIYEVKTTNPKEFMFIVREIFTNKEFEIFDIKGSSNILKGDVFFGRLQKIFLKYYFSGVLVSISRQWLDEFKEFVTEKYQEAKKASSNLSYEEFMNTNGKIVRNYSPPPLKILNSAGDEVNMCEATYFLNGEENEEVVDWLAKNKQFIITEEEYGKKGDIIVANFIHLAGEKEISPNAKGGLVTSGEWINEKGNRFKTDGSIELKKNKWVIFSTSKRIFDQMRQELEQRFGASLTLKKEQITLAEEIMNRKESNKPSPPKKSKEILKLEQEYLLKYYREWCDMKIPAFEEKTPREMIKTKEGRAKVEEMLLTFENQDLHQKKEGDWCRINSAEVIRKELRL